MNDSLFRQRRKQTARHGNPRSSVANKLNEQYCYFSAQVRKFFYTQRRIYSNIQYYYYLFIIYLFMKKGINARHLVK
jgi:hypothetical protein